MNIRLKLQICACTTVALLSGLSSARAQLTVPSDGSDGALNITADTTIDLSQAPASTWSTPGTGNGVYDAQKWAVVFKYSSVNIASGKTLTFKNNAQRAPVVWLVSGNVTIDGTVSLNSVGQEPGPGGFRGGYRSVSQSNPAGGGFGPGGADNRGYVGGSYATSGQSYGSPGQGVIYGNSAILPLIGGSGGSSGSTGGSGAILVAAKNTIAVNGSITSTVTTEIGVYGGGSGGAIRLIANAVTGTGSLDARGGYGGDGRIRIEAGSTSGSLSTFPETYGVAPASPPQIWPAADAPTIRVTSVDGASVPADPKAILDAAGADVVVNQTAAVQILLEATNVATTSTVTVRITRKYGDPLVLTASLLDGGLPLSHWKVETVMPSGLSAIQAIAKP